MKGGSEKLKESRDESASGHVCDWRLATDDDVACEVFRARDAKLNRDVALEVLPAAFMLDPDRLARFRREAQLLASLNHQNIGAIYGLDESSGEQALVLELVDGPTLADRIA
jgi:serine/threonine protein kinase